jgi:hypothetical protein
MTLTRANLAIEGMDLNAEDEALFDMLRDEAVPSPRHANHPEALRSS